MKQGMNTCKPAYLIRALAMGAVAIFATAAQADIAGVDKALTTLAPGQWDLVRIVTPSGLPMPPRPRQTSICINPAKGQSALDLSAFKIDDIYSQNCKIAKVDKSVSDNTQRVTMTRACTPDLARAASLEIVLTGDKKVSATMLLYKDAEQPWLTYHDESVWSGACN
jgi:hypothetical protein